ncbi:ISL3 family transposase [Nostoc sp. CALU 546]
MSKLILITGISKGLGYAMTLVKGKGHYCAVLIDLDASKVITMLSDRTKTVIAEVLTGCGVEVLERIEELSIDLWQGYKNLVIELMPNAQVVADRFHVMTQISKELDTQIKREKRNVEELIKKNKISSR